MFTQSAPLHTVDICGIPMSCSRFPTAAIVELNLDVRDNSIHSMDCGILASMPNPRVFTLRGRILWLSQSGINRDHPVILPLLEEFTCGSASVESLILSTVMPNLRYLRLVSDARDNWDVYDVNDDNAQAFSDAIASCPYSPIFPNVEELHYDISSNYAAGCIFVALPRVSLVRFPYLSEQDGLGFCNAFFKALIDDPLRWPNLRTIVFNTFPDKVFEFLRDFLLARSSEEHLFTAALSNLPATGCSG
jgi:hypothetical protein